MLFKSAEIRWFAWEKETLWSVFNKLSPEGPGRQESERTDYYLRADLDNTGIKIREGNHEIKVKSGRDESHPFGLVQHWMKWSTLEEDNILNTIDHQLLEDWIAVEKKRFKKSYKILGPEQLIFHEDGWMNDGCGVEFTEVTILSIKRTVYTFGLEAFGDKYTSRENLFTALHHLPLDLTALQAYDSIGYPAFLRGMEKN